MMNVTWQKLDNGDRSAELEIDGFTVNITLEEDYDHDFWDGRGRLTDKWKPGALWTLERRGHKTWYRRFLRDTELGGKYRYFIPDYTVRDALADQLARGKTIQEARAHAAKLTRETMHEALDDDHNGIGAWHMRVSVRKAGVELGSAARGGLEYQWDNPIPDYITTDALPDNLEEALLEARATLAILRA